MADFITTFSKINFTPLEPQMEDIKIEDIAHALSLMCRANGHYTEFYSVGAHCLNCYDEAVARRETPRIRMACLLHDASEAYLSDITRPVKKNLEKYLEIEERLQNLIYEKFVGEPLNEYERQMVKTIDDALLYWEFYEFTAVKLSDSEPFVAMTPDFYKGTMKQVEQAFLDTYNEIINPTEEVIVEEKLTIKWEGH